MNRKNLSLVLAFVVFCVPFSSAAEVTVCSSGCNYTKIQDAIDSANSGDIILVKDGNT